MDANRRENETAIRIFILNVIKNLFKKRGLPIPKVIYSLATSYLKSEYLTKNLEKAFEFLIDAQEDLLVNICLASVDSYYGRIFSVHFEEREFLEYIASCVHVALHNSRIDCEAALIAYESILDFLLPAVLSHKFSLNKERLNKAALDILVQDKYTYRSNFVHTVNLMQDEKAYSSNHHFQDASNLVQNNEKSSPNNHLKSDCGVASRAVIQRWKMEESLNTSSQNIGPIEQFSTDAEQHNPDGVTNTHIYLDNHKCLPHPTVLKQHLSSEQSTRHSLENSKYLPRFSVVEQNCNPEQRNQHGMHNTLKSLGNLKYLQCFGILEENNNSEQHLDCVSNSRNSFEENRHSYNINASKEVGKAFSAQNRIDSDMFKSSAATGNGHFNKSPKLNSVEQSLQAGGYSHSHSNNFPNGCVSKNNSDFSEDKNVVKLKIQQYETLSKNLSDLKIEKDVCTGSRRKSSSNSRSNSMRENRRETFDGNSTSGNGSEMSGTAIELLNARIRNIESMDTNDFMAQTISHLRCLVSRMFDAVEDLKYNSSVLMEILYNLEVHFKTSANATQGRI